MTNREIVSKITNRLRALNINDFISPKFVLFSAIDATSELIKRQSDRAKLFTQQEGWTAIDCIEMVEVPVTECGAIEMKQTQKLMKSKYPIPDTFTGDFGDIIKYVASINFNTYYNRVTPREWSAIQKRQFQGKKYYFILNNHLYIPCINNSEPSPETIRMEAFFKYKWIAENFGKQGCSDCKKQCIKPLDYDFVCSDDLIEAVVTETVKDIAASLGISIDEKANMNTYDKGQNPSNG